MKLISYDPYISEMNTHCKEGVRMHKTNRKAVLIGVWIVAMASLVCFGADVVINEIAWAGTAASTSDEWIELYNTTDEAIDLTGWALVFGETTIDLGGEANVTIEAGGYFLLERTDDGTVSDVDADVLYTGSLSNAGVVVELRNAAGEIVDWVDASETGWPAGTSGDEEPPYASMERVDPSSDVADWASNDGRIRNGADVNGDPLNGTPGRENSARISALASPAVELIAPAQEGEVVTGILVIEWSAVDPDGAAEGLAIAIELSLDGGETWIVVVENLANGGSYAWDTTLHPNADQALLRVIAKDGDGYRGMAVSPVLSIRN